MKIVLEIIGAGAVIYVIYRGLRAMFWDKKPAAPAAVETDNQLGEQDDVR